MYKRGFLLYQYQFFHFERLAHSYYLQAQHNTDYLTTLILYIMNTHDKFPIPLHMFYIYSDRQTSAQNYKYGIFMPQIQDIHVHIMLEIVTRLCQLISIMVSCLLLLHWYTGITGYQISSIYHNSQQQPTASYRQTGELLPGKSRPTRVKTTTNRIYM